MSDADERSSDLSCETEEEKEEGTAIRPYMNEPVASAREPLFRQFSTQLFYPDLPSDMKVNNKQYIKYLLLAA